MLERISRLKALVDARQPFVCVTIVQARGHAPQGAGARALVGPSGLLEGTVGGGHVEARAIAHARALLADPDPRAPATDFVTWNLQRDVDMSCGGEVSLFFEVFFRHDWRIVIFGAGHVAQSLVPLLLTLDCRIQCIDSRREWLEKLPCAPKLEIRLAEAEAEAAGVAESRESGADSRAAMAAEAARVPAGAFVLAMTQGHGHDLPILLALLRRTEGLPAFVGVIGSDVKGQALRAELESAGVARAVCESVRCPVGLPLGSNAPAEIAVSVAAQLLQERDRLRGSRWE